MDLSKLSDEDLMALKAGDLTRVSDAGLMTLKGENQTVMQSATQSPPGWVDSMRRVARVVAPSISAVVENPRAVVGGLLEVPAAVGSGMLAGAVGPAVGIGATLASGKYGTQEGIKAGESAARNAMEQITYKPRTEEGNAITQAIGKLFQDSGIIGVAPMTGEMAALSNAAPAAGNAIRDLARSGASKGVNAITRALEPRPTAIPGGGAAAVRDATVRMQRAQDLPVPIKLTKGQATRSFDDQRFERETAKMPAGEPLRQRFAEQNAQVMDNFEYWINETGAQKPNLRAVGESVDKALTAKRSAVKAKINDAYTKARTAGHMAEEVDVSPLQSFVDSNRSAASNAPVLTAIESELKRLQAGKKTISINDMEELRKMTSRLSQPGTPNSAYGGDAIRLMDDIAKDKGGPLYQQARRMYENYAHEFKDRAVVAKLLRNKPGTADRAVAFEDVFNHSIMSGSLDDVRAMRRTLQTAGDDGVQAWKELQGQTLKNIKEKITENVARDVNGRPIVSADKLNKIVENLDADGKLDFIFGKQGAAKIRDVNDMAKDIYTSPPGSVNSSNTATVLAGLLDTAISGATGLPIPVATAVTFGVKKYKANALNKKVGESLNYADSP